MEYSQHFQTNPVSPEWNSTSGRAPESGQVGGFAAEVLLDAGLLPPRPAATGGTHRGGAQQGGIQRHGAGGTEEERCLGR